MLIAARNSFAAGGAKGPTARDYPCMPDIAAWDSLENVRWGVRDSNATMWNELIGGGGLTVPDGAVFSDVGLIIDRTKNGVNTTVSSFPFFSSWKNAIDARSLTIESIWTLKNYGTNSGSGINYSARRDFGGPGTSYGLLCPEYNGRIFANAGNVGLGYYWIERNMAVEGFHSVVLTYSPNLPRANCVMYVDLAPTSKTIPSSNVTDENVTFNSLKNTIWRLGPATSSTNTSVDIVHAFRIHSRALSAEQVAANYAVDAARFNLPTA